MELIYVLILYKEESPVRWGKKNMLNIMKMEIDVFCFRLAMLILYTHTHTYTHTQTYI